MDPRNRTPDDHRLRKISNALPTYEHARRTLEIAISAGAITPEKRKAVEEWIERERARHEKVRAMVREIKGNHGA